MTDIRLDNGCTDKVSPSRRLWNRACAILADPTVIIAVVLTVALTYLVLAPLGAMLMGTVRVGLRDSAVSGLRTGSFTLSFLRRTFSSRVSAILFWKPLGRTLFVALVTAAILCGFAGLFVGYAVVKLPHSRVSRYLRQISFLPYLIPSIAFAAACISLFAVRRGPIPSLYGTMALVVIAMSVKYLPYASRAGISAMMQLGNEPEEAARVCGAPWLKRLIRIVIPLQKGGLMTGIVLPFIMGMKEQSLVIMLATPGTELLTTQVLRYIDYGYSQLANATVLEIVAIIIVLTFLAERLTGSSLAAGLEGRG